MKSNFKHSFVAVLAVLIMATGTAFSFPTFQFTFFAKSDVTTFITTGNVDVRTNIVNRFTNQYTGSNETRYQIVYEDVPVNAYGYFTIEFGSKPNTAATPAMAYVNGVLSDLGQDKVSDLAIKVEISQDNGATWKLMGYTLLAPYVMTPTAKTSFSELYDNQNSGKNVITTSETGGLFQILGTNAVSVGGNGAGITKLGVTNKLDSTETGNAASFVLEGGSPAANNYVVLAQVDGDPADAKASAFVAISPGGYAFKAVDGGIKLGQIMTGDLAVNTVITRNVSYFVAEDGGPTAYSVADAEAGRILIVTNNHSSAVTVGGLSIPAGATWQIIYDSSAWKHIQ